MSDRELLEKLYTFLKERQFVEGDPESIRVMTQSFRQPPLTMHFRVAMQLTRRDYKALSALMREIKQHLTPVSVGYALPENVIEYDDH